LPLRPCGPGVLKRALETDLLRGAEGGSIRGCWPTLSGADGAGVAQNVSDGEGETPLLLMTGYGHADAVRQLLEAGAAPSAR
jgi:ankyrin repeat protein